MSTQTATAARPATCWNTEFPCLWCDACEAHLQTAAHTCWDADKLGSMCLACEGQRRAAAAKAAEVARLPLSVAVRDAMRSAATDDGCCPDCRPAR